MKTSVVLVIGLVFAVPCVCAANTALKVNLSIMGAVVGPTKWTGAPWDGRGKADPKAVKAVRKLMQGGGEVAAAIARIKELAPKGAASAPDVTGYVIYTGPTSRELAQIASTRLALAPKHEPMENNYQPRFDVGYRGWPVYRHSLFRLVLWDADRSHAEPMGVVKIRYRDIARAVESGKPTWVNVARQSYNQILFVEIRASKAAPGVSAKLDGAKYR